MLFDVSYMLLLKDDKHKQIENCLKAPYSINFQSFFSLSSTPAEQRVGINYPSNSIEL